MPAAALFGGKCRRPDELIGFKRSVEDVFKWLDKVMGSDDKPAARAPVPNSASSPTPSASTSSTANIKKEKPLEAPSITSENLPGADDFANGILIRKVLVDRAYHPVAYEFTLQPDSTRHGENEAALIIGLLGRLGTERLSATRHTWVRMTDRDLDYSGLAALPAERIVLVIRVAEESTVQDEARLQLGRQLRAKGFRLALTEWIDTPLHRAWLAVCHFVKSFFALVVKAVNSGWAKMVDLISDCGMRSAE